VGNGHRLVEGLAELGDTYPWCNAWVSGGKYRYDCFSSIRLREEGEDLHAHSDGHAAQEAAEAKRLTGARAGSATRRLHAGLGDVSCSTM